jgi:hypothetical protein
MISVSAIFYSMLAGVDLLQLRTGKASETSEMNIAAASKDSEYRDVTAERRKNAYPRLSAVNRGRTGLSDQRQ